jgi:hypothetical protein
MCNYRQHHVGLKQKSADMVTSGKFLPSFDSIIDEQ